MQEVLRAEVRKGNVQVVVAFLRGTALPAARTLLLERMTTRILLRIGLRGALASNVVGWVLPFVLEKLVQAGHKTGLFDKLLANENVAETLAKLEELRRTTWKLLAPDAGSSAELLAAEGGKPAVSKGISPAAEELPESFAVVLKKKAV